MSGPCSEAFRTLAAELGGISCEAAAPFVTFRAPGELASPTMPVVEWLTIGGALLALAHALRIRRTTGKSAGLGLWLAAVVFVLALEPPLYFPHQIGAADHLDVIFVHNVFSVQFLYDRLPLYIVALYPAGIYLAHTLVDRLGVFERRGRFVGAVSVGFVHQCFYEIFDHLGPQLRWWAWNPNVPQTTPALSSVPLTSMVIFAIFAPMMLAYVFRRAIAEPEARAPIGGPSLALRTLFTGLAAPPLMVLAASPLSALMLAPDRDDGLIAALHYLVIAASAAVTLHAFAGAAPSARAEDRLVDRYPRWHGIAHLAVYAGLWLAATPAILAARDGITPQGTPIGSPLYAAACALFCAYAVHRATSRAKAPVVAAREAGASAVP